MISLTMDIDVIYVMLIKHEMLNRNTYELGHFCVLITYILLKMSTRASMKKKKMLITFVIINYIKFFKNLIIPKP